MGFLTSKFFQSFCSISFSGSSAWAGDLNGRAKQCSSESAARGKRKRQSKRPSTKRGIMQIPPIKISNSGETYFINRATDSTYVEKKDDIMETTQSDGEENIPIHHEESWTVATSSKKRKVIPLASARKTDTFEKNNGFQISSCIIHSAHCQKRQQRTQRKVRQTAFPNHYRYT